MERLIARKARHDACNGHDRDEGKSIGLPHSSDLAARTPENNPAHAGKSVEAWGIFPSAATYRTTPAGISLANNLLCPGNDALQKLMPQFR